MMSNTYDAKSNIHLFISFSVIVDEFSADSRFEDGLLGLFSEFYLF